jgi:hypothetical protein
LNRDAALPLIIWFHICIGLMFRLEVSNFDSDVWAVAAVAAQAVLEVVSRLTAAKRDVWVKRCSRRLCGTRARRRNTRLVVTPSSYVDAGAPSAHAKRPSERAAEPGERLAVIAEFYSRIVTIEMISEYAGTVQDRLVAASSGVRC